MPIENELSLFTIASFAFFVAVFLTLWQRTREIQKGHAETPLSDRMEKAVHYFRENKSRKTITNDVYQGLTGVSDSTATRDLQKLAEFGFLDRRGATSAIYYLFTKKTKSHLAAHTKKSGHLA